MKMMKRIFTLFFGLSLLLVSSVGWGQYAGTGTFNKITSIGELTDGYYVVAEANDEYAMNNTHNGTFLDRTAISPSLGSLADPSASIVWLIETNGGGRSIYNEGIEKYHLRVPVWENYLLYAASYINPKRYRKYEFSNYKKNLERGAGLCSTHSTVVKGILLDNGIKAELLDVGGHHVVVRAELGDNATYMLDPDYGIFVPHDTAAITVNPELAREAYRDLASHYYPDAVDPYTTDYVAKIYGDHKHVYTVDNWFEHFSYRTIWIIPFLLMLPFVISVFIR